MIKIDTIKRSAVIMIKTMFGSFFCQRLETKIKKAACQLQQIRSILHRKTHLKSPKEDKVKELWTKKEDRKPKLVEPDEVPVTITPVDDVWIQCYYKVPQYPLHDIIKMHSELLQPCMLNSMDSILYADMQLNLKTKKKTKFSSTIKSTMRFPHDFEHGQKNRLIVFCESQEDKELALSLGATFAGGTELIEDVFNKDIMSLDFDIVLSTPAILPKLLEIRNFLARMMPDTKTGTVNENIKEMMEHINKGIFFESHKTEYLAIAKLQAPFARLNMPYEHIYENLKALCENVISKKAGGRIDNSINSLMVLAPPSSETFMLDLTTEEFKDKEIEKPKKEKQKETMQQEKEEGEEEKPEEIKEAL